MSPDGTRVAVAVIGDNTDVWVWHLDDGPLTRLTFNEGLDAFPLWTPDSSRVVFASTRDGGGLFWRAADGTGAVERLLESADFPRPWGWTTDGRLVFDQRPGDIGVLTVEGDRTVEMLLETEFEEEMPALSPDGRWIAYQSNESGRSEIYVQPFPNVDDGKWQVSTNIGFDPVWSPDGRHLFFASFPFRMMVAEVETDPTFSPAPAIRERQVQLSRVEVTLRTPRPEAPDLDTLRAVLEHRVVDWKREICGELKVARMLVRRLIGPLTLHEEPAPDYIVEMSDDDDLRPWTYGSGSLRWEAEADVTALFDGHYRLMASQSVPSWNRLHGWLQQMDLLRKAA